jgi:hypothetical protein
VLDKCEDAKDSSEMDASGSSSFSESDIGSKKSSNEFSANSGDLSSSSSGMAIEPILVSLPALDNLRNRRSSAFCRRTSRSSWRLMARRLELLISRSRTFLSLRAFAAASANGVGVDERLGECGCESDIDCGLDWISLEGTVFRSFIASDTFGFDVGGNIRALGGALVAISPLAYATFLRVVSKAVKLDFRLDGLVSMELRLPALICDLGLLLILPGGVLFNLFGLGDLGAFDGGRTGTV